MRALRWGVAAIASCLAMSFSAAAQEQRTSPEEAKAFVKSAIVHYKKVGHDKALADLADKKGGWIRGDLYVNAYDMQGKCLAHVNEKTIGKDMLDLRDVDGKYLIRERLDRAKVEGSGWQDYKFFNPATKKIEPKHMYFEKFDNIVFAAGAYNAGGK